MITLPVTLTKFRDLADYQTFSVSGILSGTRSGGDVFLILIWLILCRMLLLIFRYIFAYAGAKFDIYSVLRPELPDFSTAGVYLCVLSKSRRVTCNGFLFSPTLSPATGNV